MTDGLQILEALRQADSAFPSGGFAFSHGLEALSSGGAMDAAGIDALMRATLRHRWASSDRVALVRGYRVAPDFEALRQLDREIEASSCLDALRAGSRRNGMALLTAHARLGRGEAEHYRSLVLRGEVPGHLPIAQALVWNCIGLSLDVAVLISGYQCLMAIGTASIRLGLIGAIEAQAIIGRNLPLLTRLAEAEVEDEQEFAAFLPLVEVAVMGRGRTGQRLFAN